MAFSLLDTHYSLIDFLLLTLFCRTPPGSALEVKLLLYQGNKIEEIIG